MIPMLVFDLPVTEGNQCLDFPPSRLGRISTVTLLTCAVGRINGTAQLQLRSKSAYSEKGNECGSHGCRLYWLILLSECEVNQDKLWLGVKG